MRPIMQFRNRVPYSRPNTECESESVSTSGDLYMSQNAASNRPSVMDRSVSWYSWMEEEPSFDQYAVPLDEYIEHRGDALWSWPTTKKLKHHDNKCALTSLPQEIVMEILLRLPPEDLHSLRLVSDFWLNLISTTEFIKSHLDWSQQPREGRHKQILVSTITKPTNVTKSYVYGHFSITNTQKEEALRELHIPLPSNTKVAEVFPKALCLQASCDGLILLQDKYNPRQLYIFNPVAESAFAPLPPLNPDLQCADWVLFRDSRTNRYRAFGVKFQYLFLLYNFQENIISPIITPEWKVWSFAEEEGTVHSLCVLSQLLVVGNEVHWLTIDRTGDCGRSFCIYSMNFDTFYLNKTMLPLHLGKPDNQMRKGEHHLLFDVKGSLCLTLVSHHLLEMFVLEDRQNCVWTTSLKISLESLSNRPAFLGSFLSEDISLLAMIDVQGNHLIDLMSILIHDEDDLLLFELKSQKLSRIGFLSKEQKLCRPYFIHSTTLVGSIPYLSF